MCYWETKYKKGAIWKFEPSDSAILVAKLFHSISVKNILIPGIGYGRNAKPFVDKGISVIGIEISKPAIKLARDNSFTFPIHHGSVLDMPFDNDKYDGIFCYSLLHLFNKQERFQFLSSCYNQLNKNGYMFFVIVSTKDKSFGTGKKINKNRYKIENGLKVFFYDNNSIYKEFKHFGLIEYEEFDEPIKHMPNEQPFKCFIVKCRKYGK
jgi:2-polyprenyl-3-methyl-5-hydroxy-6-metoxy-1,4-benzoquinol methylase